MNWESIRNWFTSQFFAFILIILGVLLLVFILIAYGFAGYLFEWEIDPNASAQFGDFVGGVVGAIWALAGVILFYEALKLQREDLNYQKIELQKTRQEFELSRMTDVFFKQLDFVLQILNEFKLTDGSSGSTIPFGGQDEETKKGKEAIDYVHKFLDEVNLDIYEYLKPEVNADELSKQEQYYNLIVLMNKSNDEFVNLSIRLLAVKNALESFVESTSIPGDSVSYLKVLFWNNLGTNVNEVLVKLKPTYDNYKVAEGHSNKLKKLKERDQKECINRIHGFVQFFNDEEKSKE